jgi:ribA/ribD-fused uncharacterized protein
MPVHFYRERDEPYGCFSNFSKHPFAIDGKLWPTVEHYFQAMKFVGTPREEQIRACRSPMDAKNLGNERVGLLRGDWESVQDDVMRRAVLAKFQSHPEISQILLSTGEEPIIEDSRSDYYWGLGATKTGKNMLGKILVETREIIAR